MKVRKAGIVVALLSAHAWAADWKPVRVVGLVYPEAAVIQGLEGTVKIDLHIANDGSVDWVVIREQDPMTEETTLASAAVRNAREWKFRRINSANAGQYTLTYRFQIRRGEGARGPSEFRFVMPDQVFVTAGERPAKPSSTKDGR